MDDKKRIALIDTKSIEEGNAVVSPTSLIRYQLDNHLGSASLELDVLGKVISYEEYYPYGSTSYQAGRSLAEVSLKRYRYTGKERDEETGLYNYGARYYASWLGRWVSCDPMGLVDGTNMYGYVRSNPVRLVDPKGTDSREDALKYRVELMKEAARKLTGTQGGKHLKGFGAPVPIEEHEGKLMTREGRFDPEFWEPRTELDPKSKFGMLRLKEGKKPSEAIRAIVNQPEKWYLECATFVQVLMLYARLEETMDDKKFDREMRAKGEKTGGIFLRSHKSTGIDVEREWSFEGVSNKLVGLKMGNKASNVQEMTRHIQMAPIGSQFIFQNVKTSDEFSFHLENTILVGKMRSGERLFLAWGLAAKGLVFTETEVRRSLAEIAQRKLGGTFNPLKDIRVKTLVYFASP